MLPCACGCPSPLPRGLVCLSRTGMEDGEDGERVCDAESDADDEVC